MTFLFDTTNEINKATTTSTVEHERSFNDEMEFSELNTQTQKQTQKQTTTDAIQHYIQKQFDKKKYDYAETVSCLSKTETQGSEIKSKRYAKKPKKSKPFVGTDRKLRISKSIEYRYEVEKIEQHRWINKQKQLIEYYIVWKNIKGVKKFKK